jgi:hypothetical protein
MISTKNFTHYEEEWTVLCNKRLPYVIAFVLAIVLLPMLTSCSKEKKKWIKTEDGYYFYGKDFKEKSTYTWSGESRGVTIHGNGVLTRYYEDGRKNSQKIDAYYGVLNKNDYTPTPEGGFIGEVKDNEPKGFGVLISDNGNKAIIGKFDDGKPKGFCTIYENDELRYRGYMKDGKYNGLGLRIQDGNVTMGEWDEGVIAESFTSQAKEEAVRLKNRVFHEANTPTDKSPDEGEVYLQGKEVFLDSLTQQLSAYMELCAQKTVDDRTNWLSIQPFRMFWQCLFTKKSKRIEGWMNSFEAHGLSKIHIEEFINAKIRQYNKLNPEDKLSLVKLGQLNPDDIITEPVFKNINDREYSGWGDNLWFDLLLAGLVWLIITAVTMGAFAPTWPFCEAVGAAVSIIWFIISFFNGDMESDIINGVIENYINFLSNSNIESQIFI